MKFPKLLYFVVLSLFFAKIAAVFAANQNDDSALLAQLMREVQARKILFNQHSTWPKCLNGQTAPDFPSDSFYQGEMKDPARAVELVQALRTEFAPFSGSFVDTTQPLEGEENVESLNFTIPDVDTTNYLQILGVIQKNIKKCTTVEWHGYSFVDAQVTEGSGEAYSNTSGSGYADVAKQAAIDEFNASWRQADPLDFLQEPYAGSIWTTAPVSSGSTIYRASCNFSNFKSKLKIDFSNFINVNSRSKVDVDVYLQCWTYGQSIPSPVSGDEKFHRWKTIHANGPTWTSDEYIGSEMQNAVLNAPGGISWGFWDAITLVKCKFDTSADDGVTCCQSTGSLSGCPSGTCSPGSTVASLASVHFQIAAGSGGPNQGAAYFLLNSDSMSPQLSTPTALSVVAPSTVSQVHDPSASNLIRQIVTTNSFVDIVTINDYKYEIRFYPLSAKSANTTNGVYTATGSPNKTITIENPDASTTVYNNLKITETEGSSSKVTQYSFTQPSGVDTWSLTTGSGAKTETLSEDWNTDHTVRTETRTISGGSTLLSKTVQTYTTFPWGEELTQEVSDPDGTPLTSTWDYYTNETDNDYGRVKQWVDGKGYWERYQYDSDGLLAKTIRQYLGAPVGTAESQSDVETISHPDTTSTLTVQTVAGNEVARSYTSFPDATTRKDEVWTVVGAAMGASTNLVTITKYTDSTRAKVASVQRPDGTMTIYQYSTLSTTVSEGQLDQNGTTIGNGTITVTNFNSAGYEILKTVTNIANNTSTIISKETADGNNDGILDDVDSFGRVQKWTYLDGTTRLVQYGCCGIMSETDRDGIATTYSYDSLGNPDLETRAGITTDSDYDALDRLVKTTRIGSSSVGSNPTSTVTQAAAYDLAGRQTSSTDLLGASTVLETYVGGRYTRKETLPSGATHIEVTTTDGKLLSVGGTAEHGVSYQYGSMTDGRQFTKEVQASGPWVARYVDMAGRDVRTEYPGSAAEQLQYNALGQLATRTDPDGKVTTYGYNAKGEQESVTLGTQVTTTVRDVATHGSDTVLRTTTEETGNVVVAVDEQAVTSRKQWHTDYGLTTATVTTGSGTALTKTVTAPDASTTVETYNNGRLTSRAATEAGTTYAYDGNGRLSTETDARTGRVTTTAYDGSDRVQQVSQNGGSVGTLTTSHAYSYESNGLVDTATLPGSRTSIRKYYPNGDLKSVGGTAEYAVSYAYDGNGRMRTMTTATGTTTWTYDGRRGWLRTKGDGVNPAVTYDYYPSGRLKTRTWSRGVATSYGYDAAGNLATVSYSDGTPAVTITSDNRGRQSTVQDAAGLHTFSYWNTTTRLLSADTITGTGALTGATLSDAYDSLLRRTTFTAARSGVTKASYTDGYDAKSRLSTVTDGLGLGLTATYAYLASSALVDNVTLKQSGTTRVTLDRDYDGLDRQSLSSAIPSTGTAVSYTYHYDTSGQRDTVTLADSSAWNYGYDSLGQVTSGVKKWNATTEVLGQKYAYTYDGIGNRLTTTVNTRSATYTPNALNQYTSRTVPGYVDVLGEILSASTLTVNTLTPSRQNTDAYFRQELTVSNGSAPVYLTTTVSATNGSSTATTTGKIFVPKTPEAFTYDPDGNLLSDGRWKYRWDGENRLAAMETLPAAVSAGAPKQRLSFVYDAQSRRVSKKVETWNGSAWVEHHTFLYLYDGWNLAAEIYKQTGNALRSYVWGSDLSGGQAAGGIGGLLFIRQSPENKSFSVGCDGNGNVTALHDMADASLAARYEYGPLGELIRASGYYAPINPIRWSTKYQDPESDLVYYGYRYYSPSLGRWLSRDPIEEKGGNNLYRYVANKSVNEIDYLGLSYGKHLTRSEAASLACTIKRWLVGAGIVNLGYELVGMGHGLTLQMLSAYLSNTGQAEYIPYYKLKDDPGIVDANDQAKYYYTNGGGGSKIIYEQTGGDVFTAIGHVHIQYNKTGTGSIAAKFYNEIYVFDPNKPAQHAFPKLDFVSKGCCWEGGNLISDTWMSDLELFHYAKRFPVNSDWTLDN